MRERGAIAINGACVARARKGISLVISNEDMDDNARIMKYLEKPGMLIDEVSKAVKQVIKIEGGFLGMLLGTLDDLMVGNMLTGKDLL